MSFIYLATPYSKYPKGIEAANEMASRYAARFIELGFPVFCPIAHSHSIATHGGLTAKDHGIWMPLDLAFMESAFALVVALEDGWKESVGVQKEIDYFYVHKKPIYYWTPPTVSERRDLLCNLNRDWECHQRKQKSARAV